MALLTDDVAAQLREAFSELSGGVRLAVFSQALADPASENVRRFVEELASLDPHLRAEPYNFVLDKDKVEGLAIARTPGLAVLGDEKDYGVRFYGQVAGYELATLVEAIRLVSAGDSDLRPETREALKDVSSPVHLQVFSTPSCPYCPQAVRVAYQFAIEKDAITADGIEVTGFPDLARRYQVSSVPKTVVGEAQEFVGAGPESMLLEHVLKAAQPPDGLVSA
jgi:glutaredoxin-like protein